MINKNYDYYWNIVNCCAITAYYLERLYQENLDLNIWEYAKMQDTLTKTFKELIDIKDLNKALEIIKDVKKEGYC